MSQSDPLADLFTRIRNAQNARKKQVSCPSSVQKLRILEVLKDEGYIASFEVRDLGNNKSDVVVDLKYFENKPVIEMLKRASRPGLRYYSGSKELPKVLGGLGVAIISTSQGIMSDRRARQLGEGGEVIALVS